MASKTFKIILAGDAKGAQTAIGAAQKAGDGLIGASSGWGGKWAGIFGAMGQKLSDFGAKFSQADGWKSKLSVLGDTGGSALGNLGDKFVGVGSMAALGAAGVATAMAGMATTVATKVQEVGQYLYDLGEQYFIAESKLRVGTGATGGELAALKDSYKDVYEQTAASSDQVASVMTGLEQKLHLSGQGLEDLSLQFLRFSNLTGTDVASNLQQIPRMFGDWSIAAEDQSATMDKLFRTWQETGVDLGQLEGNLVKFGGPLRQLGFDFDQSTALIAKFQAEGVNTELVLGSMRVSLGRMARANADVADAQDQLTFAQDAYNRALEEHGEGSIEAEKAAARVADAEAKLAKGMSSSDVAGMFKDQLQAIKDAGSAGEANALALELFGAKAGPDMAAAVREGRFEIDDLMGTITGGRDTLKKAGADTATWRTSWTRFTHMLENQLEPIATRVFGTINTVLKDNVIPLFRGLATAWEEGGFQGLLEALPVTLDLVKVKLAEWWDTAVTWFEDHGPEILEGLGAGIRMGLQAGGELLGALGELLETVGNWFQDTAWPYVRDHWGEWWKAITDSFDEGGVMNTAIMKLTDFLVGLGGWVLTDAIPWAFQAGYDIFFSLLRWLATEGVPTAIEGIGAMLGALVEWIETEGVTQLGNAAGSMWNAMFAPFEAVKNMFVDAWNSIDLAVNVPGVLVTDDVFPDIMQGGKQMAWAIDFGNIPGLSSMPAAGQIIQNEREKTKKNAETTTARKTAATVFRFAAGGTVYGPTLGLIGEDRRTAPEHVVGDSQFRRALRDELGSMSPRRSMRGASRRRREQNVSILLGGQRVGDAQIASLRRHAMAGR